MPSPFEMLTLPQLQKMTESVAPTEGDKESRDLYNGEHWREGDGWVGQKPPPGEAYNAQMAVIAAAFISENVVAEVIQRHRAGVLGREPRWGFVPRRPLADGEEPTAEEATLMAEADAALTSWWDQKKPLLTFQRALPTALLERRAPLRLFIPAGLRNDQGQVAVAPRQDQTPLDAALEKIYFEAPPPATAGVFTDDSTRRDAGVFTFQRYPDAIPGLPPTGSGQDCAELSYVGDDGSTIIAVIEDKAAPLLSDPLPLGRRLPLYDLTRETLITAQVRQAQKAINLALTQMVRNVNLAGSLERIMTNLMPPGQYLNRKTGVAWKQGDAAEDRVFKPEALPVGSGVSAWLRGYEIKDENGNVTGYSNGTVNYRDPVPVDTFTATRQEFRAAILAQVAQLHALISGDATASAVSRVQARAEFEASLELTKTALDDAGRWLLETVLSLAAIFAGTPGRYDQLRCEFGAIVDAGPLSADERQQIVNEYEKGLASRETSMSDLGRDDVAAEMARIDAEDQARDQRTMGVVSGRPATAQGGGAVDPNAALDAELGQGAA